MRETTRTVVIVVVAIVAGYLGGVLSQLHRSVPAKLQTIRVQQIELVDGKGTVRGTLGMENRGPCLQLRDCAGVKRAEFVMDDTFGPSVNLFNRKGEKRGIYAVFDVGANKGCPGLHFFDLEGKERGTLMINGSGPNTNCPSLRLWDAMGTQRGRFELVGEQAASPSLTLSSSAQQARVTMALPVSSPVLNLTTGKLDNLFNFGQDGKLTAVPAQPGLRLRE